MKMFGLWWCDPHHPQSRMMGLSIMVLRGVIWLVGGGGYDKRFLRPSKQGLRARLNGDSLSLCGWGGMGGPGSG